jgi:hypothetical protein
LEIRYDRVHHTLMPDQQGRALMAGRMDCSDAFINDVLVSRLRAALGADFNALAIGILGTGSDVLGLDDTLSGDHHAGPRATVVYPDAEAARIGPVVRRVLTEELPAEFAGAAVEVDLRNLMGVSACSVDELFARFLGAAALPTADLDWLALCEVDLLHVTAGRVVIDGPGELTRRRAHLAYYPDTVWRKRLADWCCYLCGRDAPYNLHRVARRGNEIACTMYLASYMLRLMQITFTLNRRYATYQKWLDTLFRRLPCYADQFAPGVDELMAMTGDWHARVLQMVDLNYVVADAMADLGVCDRMPRRPFDDGLTDLTLYACAMAVYQELPSPMIVRSFNQIEYWERLARESLLNPDDYFQRDYDVS